MSANTDLIQKIYIAYFNRPADVAGLKYWAAELDNKRITLSDLAQSFSEQVEFKQVYAGKDTRAVVSSLYLNLFGREPEAAGLQYWVEQLNAKTVRLGSAALAILQGAKPESDDGKVIANKFRYADEFTLNLVIKGREADYKSSADFNAAKIILAKVGKDFYSSSNQNSGSVSKISLLNASPASGTGGTALTQEVQLELDISKAKLGDTLELFNGDNAFPGRVFKTLSLQDLAQQSIKLSIPAFAFSDDASAKTLAVRSVDSKGVVLKLENQITIEANAANLAMPKSDEYFTAWTQNADGTLERYYAKIKFVLQAGQIKNGLAILRNGEQVLAKVEITAQDSIEFKFDATLGKQVYKLFGNSNLSLTLQDASGSSVSGNVSASGITHQFSYVAPEPAKNIKLQLIGNKEGSTLVDENTTNILVTADIDGLQAFSGSAILYLNGVAIARDNQILVSDKTVTFDLKTANNKDLLAIIKAGGVLSVGLKDSLNKQVTSQESLSLQVDQALGGAGSNPVAGTALSNLQFTAIGGDVQTNTLNSTNLGLRLTADIKAGTSNPVYAYLSLDGRVIATDNAIAANDKQVNFELSYSSTSELQAAIAKGGTLKVNLVTADGKVWGASDEILLNVTYSSPVNSSKVTAPVDLLVFDSATHQAVSNWDKTKDSITVQAKIVAGQATNGYAVLKLGGVTIAQDKIIAASDTSVSFTLNSNDYELRKVLNDNNLKFGILSVTLFDSSGAFSSSTQNPVLSIALSELNDAYYTPFMMGLSFIELGVVQKILEPDTPGYTYPTSFAKEVHLQTASLPGNIARAELFVGDRKVATDSSVMAGDKTIDFSFAPEFEGFFAYSGFNVRLLDAQGSLIEQTPNLLGIWLRGGTHRTDLNPVTSSTLSFVASGGEVTPGQFNASNTGALVKAQIPAIVNAGMRAELHVITEEFSEASNRAIATLSNLQPGITEVSFNLSNSGAHAFSNELTQGAKFEVWLISANGEIAKTVRSDVIQADYRAPDLPHQAWVLDGAAGKEVLVSVTAGQLTNGKASLSLNGQQIASDDVIGINDSTLSFKIDTQYSSAFLANINNGLVNLSISDAFNNTTAVNLKSLNVATSLANNADLTAPTLAAGKAYSHTRAADNALGLGDTIVLRFSEATTKLLAMTDFLSVDQLGRIKTANFGQGASLSWNGSGSECTITLGSQADFELLNDVGKLIVVGVSDLAGNKAELVFMP